MIKFLKDFWRLQKLSFFAAKVSGTLYDLGVDRKKLPSDPFNSFCDRSFEIAGPHETAAAFFCKFFSSFPQSSYTLHIGGYDLVFRASKIIGNWRNKALVPETHARRMIDQLEEVCRLIEHQHPKLFSSTGQTSSADSSEPIAHPEKDDKYEILAWNMIVRATDPDRCWNIASGFRQTNVPGNILTCEMAFLMASVVRGAVKRTFPEQFRDKAIAAAEAAYFKTFDDESRKGLPDEMTAVYGAVELNKIARSVLAQYGEKGDLLPMTMPLFIHRIQGDPRMLYEIMPAIQELQSQVLEGLRKELELRST